ncbi:MAG: hypothetical protein IJW25_00895, partial [Clostridia bacterium]|nr:hypothetical protein [Clostridia bacterium]
KSAFNLLSLPTDKKPCNIIITASNEEKVEKILKQCSSNLQKTILARDFVTALVMKEILKDIPSKQMQLKELYNLIQAFYNSEFNKVKQYHSSSYFPYHADRYFRKFGAFEVNFFLVNTKNVYIQKAINNFISSRTPYSVKIFTNTKLQSYQDEAGNIIQCPHDYMTRNVNEYIINQVNK